MNKTLLCDTCVIIDLINENDLLLSKLLKEEHFTLFVNSIIEMELLQGVHNKQELKKVEQKLTLFHRLEINQDILETATDLVKQYSLSHQLKLADAIIAATAMTYDVPFYTYNKRDFRYFSGIRLWAH
ncbi:MAG: type II toxin-antitoxin system VapC family toxin [Candidatus Parabeggiatoa sp. nov. 3]|jgi:predicted nucleic acid-binding protein|nr:MAG: type II toxin-antitoxin system VapC family toxin [Gammaproteobacteria bacterium]RKZ68359.1 MAG: type II toxin-antitoxin system VapC family toxin [Gammaproteobacteria bacterium]RKZ86724.1 MAG: type II toxin-antitoxin system VapC family toxin [Gammaproteobacteria bacterium]